MLIDKEKMSVRCYLTSAVVRASLFESRVKAARLKIITSSATSLFRVAFPVPVLLLITLLFPAAYCGSRQARGKWIRVRVVKCCLVASFLSLCWVSSLNGLMFSDLSSV